MARFASTVFRSFYLALAFCFCAGQAHCQVLTISPADILVLVGDSPTIPITGSIFNNTPKPISVDTVVTALTSNPPGLAYNAVFDLGNYTAANGPIAVNPGELFVPSLVGLDRLFTLRPLGTVTRPGYYSLGVALFTDAGSTAQTSIRVAVVPEPSLAWPAAAVAAVFLIFRARRLTPRRCVC